MWLSGDDVRRFGLPAGLEFMHEAVFALGEKVPDIPLLYGDSYDGYEPWWWANVAQDHSDANKPLDERVEKYLRESTPCDD